MRTSDYCNPGKEFKRGYYFSHGIAMVEVLITTLITAIGILAVILLINNLKTSSIESKQRVEALALAVTKIESLQNTFELSQYLSIISGKEDVIVGKNGSFYRSWKVTETGQDDSKVSTKVSSKVIKLIVSWSGEKGQDEQVQLNTIINWNDPLKSASIASYGVDSGFVYLAPNQMLQLADQHELLLPDNALTIPLPYQMKKYTDEQANLHILDEENHVLLTLFADIKNQEYELFQISGQVYYPEDIINEIQILASNAAYCLFPIEQQAIAGSNWQSAKYFCITAKGWKGKIGIMSSSNGLAQKTVCPDRSREYLHYSLLAGQLFPSGIKQNYEHQDFIINTTSSEIPCSQQADAMQTLVMQTLASDVIINAENHSLLESDNVNSISGFIKFSDLTEINRLDLFINSQDYDCRLLNHLDHSNDAYSCVVEVPNPSESNWMGTLKAEVYLSNPLVSSCSFSLPFSGQSKSIILDIDLESLCPNQGET